MTTFLQFAQNMADRLDETRPSTISATDVSSLSQTIRRYRRHLNLAYSTIWLALGFKNEKRERDATFDTVAGTEAYDIPGSLTNVLQISFGNDPPIDLIPWPEYERYKRDTLLLTTVGEPYAAAIFARQIWLYPTPTSVQTVTVRGQEVFTEMSTDSSTPDFPSEFHPCLEEFAMYYEMAYENNPTAGTLIVAENGSLQGQGGQAATAVNMLNLIKRNAKKHMERPARMMHVRELAQQNAIRRLIKG